MKIIKHFVLNFRAEVTFETLKQTFGASNCFILTINSKSASDPILTDLWAPYIKRAETSVRLVPTCFYTTTFLSNQKLCR